MLPIPGVSQFIVVTPNVRACVGKTATILFSAASPIAAGQTVTATVNFAGDSTVSGTINVPTPIPGVTVPVPFTIDSRLIDFISCP